MIDLTKIEKLVKNTIYGKFSFVRNKEEEEKVVIKEVIKIFESILKENIDDKGHYMVDGVIYDYKTDEFVRNMTEEEIEMLYKMRNLKRKLKYM